MNTEYIEIEHPEGEFSDADLENLKRAGEIIKKGGLVAFPTETVYGLGGDALNPESSCKIYAAKGRPSDNPLIVHICRMEDLEAITADIPNEAILLADRFWPGPLTMVLPKSDLVPKETTGGLDTVAVRMPSDKVALEMIRQAGGYVAAPSANLSGKPSPTKAEYVKQDMDGRIEMILDGGENIIGLESTIVDLTVSPPQVLRPGYITNEMLGEALRVEVPTDPAILNPESGGRPKAPGMKYRHYAPKGSLTVVRGEPDKVVAYINQKVVEDRIAGNRIGVIATQENLDSYDADLVLCAGSAQDVDAIGHRLYAMLREFDDAEITSIYSESFDGGGARHAIMNRLLKAAGHQMIDL